MLEGKRLTCILHISTNSTNKPMITLINYDDINPGTIIRISFSGIQSLKELNIYNNSIGGADPLNYHKQFHLPLHPYGHLARPHQQHRHHQPTSFGLVFRLVHDGILLNNNIVRQSITFQIGVQVHYEIYSSDGSQVQPKFLVDPLQLHNHFLQLLLRSGGVLLRRHQRFGHTRSISGSGVFYWIFSNFPSSAFTITD